MTCGAAAEGRGEADGAGARAGHLANATVMSLIVWVAQAPHLLRVVMTRANRSLGSASPWNTMPVNRVTTPNFAVLILKES